MHTLPKIWVVDLRKYSAQLSEVRILTVIEEDEVVLGSSIDRGLIEGRAREGTRASAPLGEEGEVNEGTHV